MAKNRIQMQGFKEIDQILAALPKSLGQKTVRQALRKGVKPYVKAAKLNASHADNTGGTSKSIGVINSEGGITIGPRRGRRFKKGYVAHLLEYGAAPHIIKPKMKRGGKAKVLAFNGGFVTGPVNHPGIQAQPFLRPAWDTTNGQVRIEIARNLQEVLQSNFKGVFK